MPEIENIYDNEEFFGEYQKLRQDENSYNTLIEQPTMSRLVPNLQGKTVLDLGCGYGYNAIDFIKRGAKKVIAIDLSEKMLEVAKRENSHPSIEYYNMDMSNISSLNCKFDLVYSSLAFHYVKDFSKLIEDISNLLNEKGVLLFSQEHPLTTATIDGKGAYNRAEDGKYLSYTMSNYNEEGKRVVTWFIEGLVKYHRPFSKIVNSIINAGLKLTYMEEPLPSEKAIALVPKMVKERIKPSFLVIKAEKE